MSNESLFPQISLSQYQTQIEPMFDIHFEFFIETFAHYDMKCAKFY